MWSDSVEAWSLTPAHLVLLEEACRTADRCSLLDDLIRGYTDDPGGDEDESGSGSGRSGGITALLAEARAQQTALKGLVAELRQGQRLAGSQSGARPSVSGDTGGSGVTSLSARIAAKRQAQG
jgi:hypothetical protein